MADAVKRSNVCFMGGDFNMSLFEVKKTLRAHDIDAQFLGSYAWRQITRGCGVPGLPGCRYDSLGFFAVQPTISVSRMLTLPSLHGSGGRKLDEFENVQGYPASAYLGGESAILAAFEDHTHGDGDAMLPPITQKALRPKVWDATGHLHGKGAHMPLLFYVGALSRRSDTRLEAREANMVARGWGPGSWLRANLMEQMGKNKGKGKDKGGKGKDKDEDEGKGVGPLL